MGRVKGKTSVRQYSCRLVRADRCDSNIPTIVRSYAKHYIDRAQEHNMDYLDIPAFLRRQPEDKHKSLVDGLNKAYPATCSQELDVTTFYDLLELGIDEMTLDTLRSLVSDGLIETEVVLAWLLYIVECNNRTDLSRHVRRLISVQAKRLGLTQALKVRVVKAIEVLDTA